MSAGSLGRKVWRLTAVCVWVESERDWCCHYVLDSSYLLALPAFGEHRPVGSKYALVPVQAHLGCSLCWEIPAPLKGVLLRAPARGMLEQLVGWGGGTDKNQPVVGTGGGSREPLEAGVCSRGSGHCTLTWRPSPRAGGAEVPWSWGQQASCRGPGRPWPTVHLAAGVRGAPPGCRSVPPGTRLTLLIGTWCLEDVPAPWRRALHRQASPAHPHTPSRDPCAGQAGALVPPLPPALGTLPAPSRPQSCSAPQPWPPSPPGVATPAVHTRHCPESLGLSRCLVIMTVTELTPRAHVSTRSHPATEAVDSETDIHSLRQM
ncbi:uncharacterized protein LOC122452287 [Cervus canadensis]|uniref:uncharacterized protein LOC122452287 n=1 Tax=Cervus canadensis TaxID=1574408 RepID=UPI001C9E6189|nr:uncharacterized protein LOC122452287 [Cervus canadensis]